MKICISACLLLLMAGCQKQISQELTRKKEALNKDALHIQKEMDALKPALNDKKRNYEALWNDAEKNTLGLQKQIKQLKEEIFDLNEKRISWSQKEKTPIKWDEVELISGKKIKALIKRYANGRVELTTENGETKKGSLKRIKNISFRIGDEAEKL